MLNHSELKLGSKLLIPQIPAHPASMVAWMLGVMRSFGASEIQRVKVGRGW